MFEFSPQVKRSVIISNKHGVYELADELPNNLRLRILEKGNISKLFSLMLSLASKMKIFSILAKTFVTEIFP